MSNLLKRMYGNTEGENALIHYGASNSHNNANRSSTPFTTAKLPIETVKSLIMAISRKPSLWMRNNQLKRDEITKLWQEVSEEVQLSVDICRIKWGHLRDNFRKVYIRNTFSTGNPTTWRFYNDMRFMEDTVAENIRKQNNIKAHNDMWLKPEPNVFANAHYRHSNGSEDFRDNFEFGFNFSNSHNNNNIMFPHKRIKLQNKSFEFANNSQMHSNVFQHSPNSFNGSNSNYGHQVIDDDDDYDEDNIPEDNEDCSIRVKNEFCIEVFDDEEEENSNRQMQQPEEKSFPIFSTKVDAATDTEPTWRELEQDSDRMFLLSLLPYLKNVDKKKKLQVRQKLQYVLIDELS